MAKCEQGYLCEVCHRDVEDVTDSDLYLRYVIGFIDPENLHTSSERHIRCNPGLAQFIVHADFEPVIVSGAFRKQDLDPQFVRERESLVTRGWLRLREIQRRETSESEMAITDYPLPEVLAAWQRRTGGFGSPHAPP